MNSVLVDLEVTTPVLAAPMAGGPSTVALIQAAAEAGSLGFLAGGYQTAEQLLEQIRALRGRVDRFGVNLFAPNPVPISMAEYRAYSDRIRSTAERFEVELPAEPISDDDGFSSKLQVLLDDPVPMVSFTFGLPDAATVTALQARGTVVVQSVTTASEALAASQIGVDLLAVQGCGAGGHSATLTPAVPPADIPLVALVSSIRAVTDVPILAGGGLNTPGAVAEVIEGGAIAALVGTALLRCPESGTSATHRAAIADWRRRETVLTRAFTGRPARGIRNSFIDQFDAVAPAGYPALHHLTRPLRKAAAEAGDPEAVHLWAGTGFREAQADPAAMILTKLVSEL